MHSPRTLRELFGYGVLGLPLAALGLPLVVYLPAYYATLPALGTGLVGTMLIVARFFDVVSDPAIGWASDRFPTRFGRRRPWIAAGVPLLMVAAWFLFVPPDSAGWGYLLSWSVLAYLGWTLIYLPYTTLGAELSGDYDERSRVTAFREGFFALGTLVAIALPALIAGGQGGDAAGLAAVAVFLLIGLPLAAGIFLWLVPEPRHIRRQPPDWARGLRLLAGNAPFRRLLIAYLLNGAANGLPAALFMFFVLHVLGGDQIVAGAFLGVYFLSAIAGLPVWLWLGRGWSKHRLWCTSMLFVSAVFAFVPLLGEGDYLGYALICILGGSVLGIDQAIPASIQADVIDEDTAGGGDGRAGLYFGLWGMATKLAFALSLVAFPILEWSGFDASAESNSDGSLVVLALLYGVLPVAVKVGVVALMWRFPLGRERHAHLQASIESASSS
ncbi:MFS transporter [Salinisphaera sp. P385]|uniref:MFS transporter n=1 Tax=Spectribacter acetivorans TaxID=3075603 RepID=A0ABU3BDT6_9GAMM|nr:MFS transporter [Salinisphaera sp. P385]MDT0619663.1 MFS transporter [Salinisphaera sp. P385]